jgi:hypothetical protein
MIDNGLDNEGYLVVTSPALQIMANPTGESMRRGAGLTAMAGEIVADARAAEMAAMLLLACCGGPSSAASPDTRT